MNKIGLHNGFWRGTEAQDAGLYKLLELTNKTTCEVIEIGPDLLLGMTPAERLDFKKALADMGMELSINGGFTNQNDIAADDPAIRRIGIEWAKNVLQAMYEVGCDRWSGINYSEWLRRPAVPDLTPEYKDHVRGLSIDSMREIIKTAEDCGVNYCFEIVNRFEQFIMNTSAEGVSFCEDVGSPNAKLLLDTFHMNIEEDNIADAIRYAQEKGRLGHIHVGESNRRIPGFDGKTHMDWDTIMGAMKDSGYQGYVVMEPFMKMGMTTICCWRDLSHGADLATMTDYAKKGAQFLRSKLA
ncbi:sugar phosphate isomerase/epimerase family protein [Anaerolentibacter hominis]|uniref:sugar phosphate isomerase/epimerase family protein n=1 Tax=Anaerolentibacter hominis TaxID=3079009 RepID=UPI0031B80366